MPPHQYKLEIRFGNELLEAGFTTVPNLFLKRYKCLGISDAAAMWIVHLLRFKWSEEAPYPTQGGLPMACNHDTRRRHARQCRRSGILFTCRRYYTKETAPTPELAGKLQSLEYHFDALFHNILRVDNWLAAKKPLSDFAIELPADVVKQTATHYFQDVPKHIKALCEQHFIQHPGSPLLLRQLSENHTVDQLLCDFQVVENQVVENQVVENRIGNEEDSCSYEDTFLEEEEFVEEELLQPELDVNFGTALKEYQNTFGPLGSSHLYDKFQMLWDEHPDLKTHQYARKEMYRAMMDDSRRVRPNLTYYAQCLATGAARAEGKQEERRNGKKRRNVPKRTVADINDPAIQEWLAERSVNGASD